MVGQDSAGAKPERPTLRADAASGRNAASLAPIIDSDTFTYDAANQMLSATSARYGNTVSFVHDAAGRQIEEALTVGASTFMTVTTYDAASRSAAIT